MSDITDKLQIPRGWEPVFNEPPITDEDVDSKMIMHSRSKQWYVEVIPTATNGDYHRTYLYYVAEDCEPALVVEDWADTAGMLAQMIDSQCTLAETLNNTIEMHRNRNQY